MWSTLVIPHHQDEQFPDLIVSPEDKKETTIVYSTLYFAKGISPVWLAGAFARWRTIEATKFIQEFFRFATFNAFCFKIFFREGL